ncbi:MAG: hypothetical protein ACFHXK_20765 [bacterium]
MTDDIEITLSALSRSYTENDTAVEVDIYSGNKKDWVLEIVSEDKTIIIENTFPSDAAAFSAFEALVAEYGLAGLLASG